MTKKNSELHELLRQDQLKLSRLSVNKNTEKIIKNAALHYSGNGTTLESAIGALHLGQLYGWRILRILHGSTTYNNYEDILGIKFTEICDPEGPLAHRSRGLRLAKHLKSFWKVATGKVKTGGDTRQFDSGDEEIKIPK